MQTTAPHSIARNTYTLMAISNRMAAIGMMNNPSQNTGDENIMCSMPTNTAASGIVGQKLLQKSEI